MRKSYRIIWLMLFLLPMLSCNRGSGRKKLNDRITFRRKDKIPYGTFVAYESLQYLFPNAEITINKTNFATLAQGEGGKKALIFIGQSATMDASQVNAMLSFVGQGNHVFISSFYFDDSLLHALNLRTGGNANVLTAEEGLRVSVLQPITNDSLSFAYPGAAIDNYVDSLDPVYATVLGRNEQGRPNLVKFSYKGGGSILLHFAPMAFTNFFLLHKNNKAYYDNVLSYIPNNVNEVLWDENFRYGDDGGKSSFSALRYILNSRPLAISFWLLLGLLLIIYLIESKRRQRIVPVIEGLRNNSLDFITTIGRLYYQRRDNQNLVVKMATHFQDHIRTKYNLSIHMTDEGFADRLAYKTGISKEFLSILTEDLLRLQDSPAVSDEELLTLNNKLEEFYKQG
ncbi:hypothetical protein Q4E93_11500 [Flavitalea sp. BT771]|uniref:DUF4350 domain-containing protein n=1 Tax=Flavitalea sp. BT771 TaxID=3063329 RepID=UPI0026E21891|nr:DUF4350 domain-containing protein [Flavitalea sp. BT771]MDO6431218.1 hypothetical protein [Flavitalea sp. BT771]MDV6220125.1 DUF4350 domain-containing protein [Flavitalea sp. BT771]